MKLCRVCLEEEDSILHQMYEFPPVRYMADVVSHDIQAHYNNSITKNTKNYSPSQAVFSPAGLRVLPAGNLQMSQEIWLKILLLQ